MVNGENRGTRGVEEIQGSPWLLSGGPGCEIPPTWSPLLLRLWFWLASCEEASFSAGYFGHSDFSDGNGSGFAAGHAEFSNRETDIAVGSG